MRVLVTPINNPEETITKILKNFNIQLEGKKVFVKINAVDFRRGVTPLLRLLLLL